MKIKLCCESAFLIMKSTPTMKNIVRLLGLTAIGLSSLALESRGENPVNVVLLAGQSNMGGNTLVTNLAVELRQPPPNVTLVNDGKIVRIGSGSTFGPEVGFAATAAAARPDEKLLLVKLAKSGTSLAGWSPQWDQSRLASIYDTNAGPLYRTLLEQFNAATQGKNIRLTAILWMQGESDTRYPALGPNYFQNFTNLIAAFRRDLGQPDLPFIFGRVNMPADALENDQKTIKFRFINDVRVAQERAAREVPGVQLIETDDLNKQADRIHYDAKAQVELGRRFAQVWLAKVEPLATNAAMVESPAQRDARTAWWREARFGMFIHWDMSSLAGTEISWSRQGSKPLDIYGDPAGYVEDPAYDNLYKNFNPTNFNAQAWVQLAKAAGMKYLVFTAKHHGGFSMWDTKLTDYSIMHTPFKRDVLKELADACHVEGLRFGIYYSPRDWHHPDYGIGDNAKYVAYMDGQLRELLTNYGTVDVLWFDSYGRGDALNFWHIPQTWALIKNLQPQIVINNRLAALRATNNPPVSRGDFDTPEQKLGSYRDTHLWESCMTVVEAPHGGWSYRTDGKVKSFEETVRMLMSCATGDGNLLLDVGPDSTGVIPPDQSDRLLKVGEWLKQNGESICGTRGGPFKPGEYGGTTRKGKTIYVHVFKWPEAGVLKFPNVAANLVGACLLGGGKVDAKQTQSGLEVAIAESSRQKAVTVIALEFDSQVMRFPAVAVAPAVKNETK